MKPALRTPLLNLHLWTGLTVGLVFIVVAVSGAALVFRGRFERTFDPQQFVVTPGPPRLAIDDLVARAKVAHPAAEFISVRYYGDPTMPFLAYFTDKNYVHLNPYTGAVLGVRARYGEGFGWVEGLHKYLRFEPAAGEIVNSSFAVIFMALTLAGVVLWWPATRRALVAGLTLNTKLAGRPWNLSLHKTVGFYVSLVLLFSAATGIFIGLDSTRVVLDWITGSKHETAPSPPGQKIATFAGFDAVARELESRMPAPRETYIPLPKDGLVAAYAIAADASHPNARSYVYLDAAARVLHFRPYAGAAGGYRLYYWLMSLHTGVTGGYMVQMVLLFAALAVPVLAWTGTASYLQRKRRAISPADYRAAQRQPEVVSAQ